MKRIKIILDRGICIDCQACIPEAEDYFVANESKEVHLKGDRQTNGEREELTAEVTEKQEGYVKSAVGVCPVEAIKVEEDDQTFDA